MPALSALLRAGLDTFAFGFAVFDRNLRLVASNKAFRTLRGYPTTLCKPGIELLDLYRFNARRGDYGSGDVEMHALSRLDRVRRRESHELEYELPAGQVLLVQYTPIVNDGLVLTYTDITARKRAEQDAALDNMPGALAYTDENLNIVVCNDRFAEMYDAPRALLQRGRQVSPRR